jgi:hypothetical protein
MDTKEYDIYIAKERLQDMTAALSELTHAKLTQREEVIRWTRVAIYFTDKELWQAVDSLVTRGVIPEKHVGSDRRMLFEKR